MNNENTANNDNKLLSDLDNSPNPHDPDSVSQDELNLLATSSLVESLETMICYLPTIRFLHPKETTESFIWFNKIISLKWNPNK